MAILRNNIFDLSGECDNIIYRIRKGRTIAYARPGPYHFDPEKQKNCISPKNKFSYAVWLASFLNEIPLLKKIWSISKVKNSTAYYKIMGSNVNYSHTYGYTEKNLISPPGLDLLVKEVTLTDDSIRTFLEIKDEVLSVPFQALGVIYSYNPVKEKSRDFLLAAVSQEVCDPVNQKEFNISFYPDKHFVDGIKSYQNWIMYFTLIKDNEPDKIIWTSTASYSGTNE